MPDVLITTPRITVRLFKTIQRKDGVSERYKGKEESIDLTPFLNDGSAVRVSKSVRNPAGAFSLTFADRPQNSVQGALASQSSLALETVYGLVEPMDVVEIRIWPGIGKAPARFPIAMRGFVSEVYRSQTMGGNGVPQRQVVVTGQDYGKIWQTYQVLYLPAYANGKPLLTAYQMNELFGVGVVDVMAASEFVRTMIEKVINPHLAGFLPENTLIPRAIIVADGVSVSQGKINNSYHDTQGSIWDVLKSHADVGVWNELYTEDREDGVHVVYRPIPALDLQGKKILSDAPDPVFCEIPDEQIQSVSVTRSDANVANFYWVTNSRFDMVDEAARKLYSLPVTAVSTTDYENSSAKYYGVRPMYGHSQQAGENVLNMGSGQDERSHMNRREQVLAWIDQRRDAMMRMNRDNVVFESGSARVKGGPLRADNELMRAGDYARFQSGRLSWDAYVTQVDHEFLPFQSYVSTLYFERGTGFIVRTSMEGDAESPWLAEQARRESDGEPT